MPKITRLMQDSAQLNRKRSSALLREFVAGRDRRCTPCRCLRSRSSAQASWRSKYNNCAMTSMASPSVILPVRNTSRCLWASSPMTTAPTDLGVASRLAAPRSAQAAPRRRGGRPHSCQGSESCGRSSRERTP
uniref:Uncharacterized protein n=1 Tax=Alexandrium monilatum TaxID=311494 RepID=A0A7S4VPA6_9DINO